jgi:hypothetical protein
LSFPSLSFVYKSIVFLLFGSTDNSSSSLLLHHLLVSTPIHKEMLAWILIPHLRRILPMRAMICQAWTLRMRSFSRRITGEEEEDEEEERNEEEGNEEGNEEDEPVSNDDMEHSISVVASGHSRGIRL